MDKAMPAPFTVTAWGPERPEMTFRATSAGEAYDLVLSKAVYASLQARVTDENGKEITLEELSRLANRLAE